MDATPPERLSEVPAPVPLLHPGGVPSETISSDFFDAGVAGGIVPLSIKYSAIRDLREANPGGQDETLGVLFGSYAQSARIELCLQLPVHPDSRASQSQTEEALIRNMEAITASFGADGLEPIGLFRKQAGAWPAMSEFDCELVRRCLCAIAPRRALFLLVRTFAHRPWSAGVFLPDHKQPATWKAPVLEFPFDEYLLRNGYLGDFGSLSQAPVETPSRGWWRSKTATLAGVTAALLLLGAAVVSWLRPAALGISGQFLRSSDSQIEMPKPSSMELRVTRSGDYYDVTWNRNARILDQALEGTLLIRDGLLDRAVKLSGSQLREGHVLYQSLSSSDMDFRLVITDGTHSEAQSVRVLEWGTKAGLRDLADATHLGPASAAPFSGKKSDSAVALPAIENAPRSPSAGSVTPGSGAGLSPARTAQSVFWATGSEKTISSGQTRPPERPQSSPTAVGDAVPPFPVRRVSPEIDPTTAKALESAVGKLTVSVRMSVGEDGSVKQAQVTSTSGNPPIITQLANACIAAARQWKFQPGKLNGKPTSADFVHKFGFPETRN